MRRSRPRAERCPIPTAGRAATRSWLAALFVGLIGLGSGLPGCEADREITLRPVELVDPIAAEPLELDPSLALAPLDCVACSIREVELVGGDRIRVRGREEPALRIAPEQVEFVELIEEGGDAASRDLQAAADRGASPELDGSAPVAAAATRYSVYAVLSRAEQEAFARFLATEAAGHGRRFLLVELAGRPVDLVRPLGAIRGVRIGVFADASSRRAYVETLAFQVRSAGSLDE